MILQLEQAFSERVDTNTVYLLRKKQLSAVIQNIFGQNYCCPRNVILKFNNNIQGQTAILTCEQCLLQKRY